MNVSALILTLMLAVTLSFSAAPAVSVAQLDSLTPEETVVEIVETLEGTLAEITEEGLLLETDFMGPVLVKLGEETVLDGFAALEELLPGCMITVDYNGMMTRSIPAQITADRVTSYQLTGTVTEVLESAFMLETQTHGPVQVNIDVEAGMTLPEVNDQVTVTFNGAMTMSLPAQVGAWIVE